MQRPVLQSVEESVNLDKILRFIDFINEEIIREDTLPIPLSAQARVITRRESVRVLGKGVIRPANRGFKVRHGLRVAKLCQKIGFDLFEIAPRRDRCNYVKRVQG